MDWNPPFLCVESMDCSHFAPGCLQELAPLCIACHGQYIRHGLPTGGLPSGRMGISDLAVQGPFVQGRDNMEGPGDWFFRQKEGVNSAAEYMSFII